MEQETQTLEQWAIDYQIHFWEFISQPVSEIMGYLMPYLQEGKKSQSLEEYAKERAARSALNLKAMREQGKQERYLPLAKISECLPIL